MYAHSVNKTTVIKSEDVTDENLKRRIEADAMATFEPHENDVLCGRGGSINNHIGNEKYRVLVNQKKRVYLTARFKREKRLIAASIVQTVRGVDPPGRFLQRDPATGVWHDIGDTKARDKTSQALREGAPEIRKEIENDRKMMLMGSNNEDDEEDYEENENDEVMKGNCNSVCSNQGSTNSSKSKHLNNGNASSIPVIPISKNTSNEQQYIKSTLSATQRNEFQRFKTSSVNSYSTPNIPYSSWVVPNVGSKDSNRRTPDYNLKVLPSGSAQAPMNYHNQMREQGSMKFENEIASETYHQDRRRSCRSHDNIRNNRQVNVSGSSSKSWNSSGSDNYPSRKRGPTQQRQFNNITSHSSFTAREHPENTHMRPLDNLSTSSYYNDPRIVGSATLPQHNLKLSPSQKFNTKLDSQQQEVRHMRYSNEVYPDGKYIGPTGACHNQRTNHLSMNIPSYTTHPSQQFTNFHPSQSSTPPRMSHPNGQIFETNWEETRGDVMPTGCHPNMPPPTMRLPSWDSDLSANMNVFDHDAAMSDQSSHPMHNNSVHHPESREIVPACTEAQLVTSANHNHQLVKSRPETEDWSSRFIGCNALNNMMPQDWSIPNMFYSKSNTFDGDDDVPQLCGMDICSPGASAMYCTKRLEDDPTSHINNFYQQNDLNSLPSIRSKSTITSPQHATIQQTQAQPQNVVSSEPMMMHHSERQDVMPHGNDIATERSQHNYHDIKPMHSWGCSSNYSDGSRISAASGRSLMSTFGSDIGSDFSKILDQKLIEPLPIDADTSDLVVEVPPAVFSSAIDRNSIFKFS